MGPDFKEKGRVLASETNKAFDAIPVGYDWCFYNQGDEGSPEKIFAGDPRRDEKNLHQQGS